MRPKNITKTCPVCNSTFSVSSKHRHQQCCSKSCANTIRYGHRRLERSCATCGVTFTTTIALDAKYCSNPCRYEGLRKHGVDQSDIDRVWAKADKSGGPDACWIWTANRYKNGYGAVSWKGKARPVTRVVWEITHGLPLPEVVCHSCDNPSCVNPSHLFAGTQKDNVDDMWGKGRGVTGERHHQSRLTEDAVRDIRRNCVPGSPDKGLASFARKYGVCGATIESVWHRRTWIHVDD